MTTAARTLPREDRGKPNFMPLMLPIGVALAALQLTGLALLAQDRPMGSKLAPMARTRSFQRLRETGLLKEWPADGPPRLWSVSGLGDNIHSVAIAQGKVFTVGNREGSELVVGFNEATGEQVWITRVGPAIEENSLMRWLSQRAPTLDDSRLFWFTLKGELVCLNTANGAEIWRKNCQSEFGASPSVWGYCDFPFVDGPALICTPLGTNVSVAALDKATGALLWKTLFDGKARTSYAPTIVCELAGIRQYVVSCSAGLFGAGTGDGKLLWHFNRPARLSASTYTPAVYRDGICSPNGYGGGIVGIQVTREANELVAREQYRIKLNLTPFQDSTAQVGDRLYLARSNLVCLDLKSGNLLWGEATGSLGERTAMTFADGHIYLQRDSGIMELIEITSNGPVLKASFPIPEHRQAHGVTSPVVVGGRLYVRDSDRLHCYAVSSGRRPASDTVLKTIVALPPANESLQQPPSTPPEARTGVDRAPDAVFLPTPQEIVEKMLELAQVQKRDRVVDLGSGDGRFVITAAKIYGAHATGYEIDARLVQQSTQAIVKEGLESLARIEHADLFTIDLKDADVVTVFLYPRLMERLIPQFEKLKPGARIISHQFEMPGMKPDRGWVIPCKEDGENHRILLWTTPLQRQ